MSKLNTSEAEWARAPPPSGPVWRTIAHALYNPDEKSFLGRTPKRWAIVLTFYSVFYAVLALMFAACMGGLFLTIDPKKPSYTLDSSLIGNNPGVASRPLPDEGFVLRYDVGNATEVALVVKQLDDFLKPYQSKKLIASEVCTAQDKFGYPDAPCFFIKLNKIIGWKPECYNEVASLPEDMPDDLKDYISSEGAGGKLNQIWVSCWEEKSNLTAIEYPWSRGLPAHHYPYMNDGVYLSPLVAIKLTPQANTNIVIRCRVWAKNVVYNKSLKEPSGFTRIQLFIQDDKAANGTLV